MQIRRYGEIKPITKFMKNEIINYEDYAEIILRDKNHIEVGRTKIDLEIVDLIKDIKWYLHTDGYVRNRKVGSLHRYIMPCTDDNFIDHINHDRLDNRRENLRICNNQENQFNRSISKNNSSGVTGVQKMKSGRWRARIMVNKKEISLGTYDSLEEAAEARRQAEIEYFGEFSPNH